MAMTVSVVLLALTTTTVLSGVAAVTVRIRAYNATGELDIGSNSFTLGTRVLMTCDVTGLPEGNEVVSYRWYYKCRGRPNIRCEIQDTDPYYRVVSNTLLVDVTSWDQGGRYFCTVYGLHRTRTAATRSVSVAGNSAPFLYTSTSLLPEHSVLTDVQQATGRNGQQWITCRSVGQGTRPQIWLGNELVANNSTANSVTIGLDIQHSNGLYHCLSTQSQKKYFSLFLSNSVTLPKPTVSGWNTPLMWTLTPPDGSEVARYIVEFECRVRNMTFVEKYMSVCASGGTEQIATSVSCFGGLGQVYRVKVWVVSGPNISPSLVCTTDGQCREEGGRGTPTIKTSIGTPATPTTPTATLSRATPTTPTSETTTSGNTNKPSPTTSGPRPQGPCADNVNMQSDGTCVCTHSMVVPISIGALMVLVGIATLTAGVVMLVKAKRLLHHSFQSPTPGTDHYEMVDEGEKRAPLGTGVYEEVNKQDTQTDGHTKNYQELDQAKMERREYASIKV